MVRFTNTSWVFIDYTHHINPLFSSLAAGLGEEEMVIVVGQPISIIRSAQIPSFRDRCRWKDSAKRLGHYHPLHFPERIPGIPKLGQSLNFYLLKKDLDRLLPPYSFRILFYGCPTHYRLAGRLGEGIKIYYAQDDRKVTLTGDPIPGEREAERKLLARIDLVLCVSDYLARQIRGLVPFPNGLPIHVFPNHFNERLFTPDQKWPEPEPLRGIPRPRILVAGHISERIDWDGIRKASLLRPQWTWVFKGSADPGIPSKISKSLGPRAIYLSPTSFAEVPAWIAHCDAGAAPYRLNSFTLASNPTKVIEYFAMGLPVLATRIPSLERYGEAVEWVVEGDGESYACALDRLQKQIGDQQWKILRQKSVADDSLGNRVRQLREIIFPLIHQPYSAIEPRRILKAPLSI